MSAFIIAEAGVNHNGELDMALALIDVAAEAGADAVKFQTFNAEALAASGAPKAVYQNETTDSGESQLEMLKRLELSHDLHRDLIQRCEERDIGFLSTPFDIGSLHYLVNDLGLQTLKIPSGEITNGPLLLEAGKTGCDIILSTGMSNIEEIEEALSVLAFAMTQSEEEPSRAAFAGVFEDGDAIAALVEKITLLHCTTEYPAPFEDTNLNAMDALRGVFGLDVGLSDHTLGIVIPIAAAALGASVIEKHFTLDRSLPGPDHRASLEPEELKAMVQGIRATEAAMGDGVKQLQPSEIKNMPVARKSLIALKVIKEGETFSENNLGVKRPGTGASPMGYWDKLGKTAERDFDEGEIL